MLKVGVPRFTRVPQLLVYNPDKSFDSAMKKDWSQSTRACKVIISATDMTTGVFSSAAQWFKAVFYAAERIVVK